MNTKILEEKAIATGGTCRKIETESGDIQVLFLDNLGKEFAQLWSRNPHSPMIVITSLHPVSFITNQNEDKTVETMAEMIKEGCALVKNDYINPVTIKVQMDLPENGNRTLVTCMGAASTLRDNLRFGK